MSTEVGKKSGGKGVEWRGREVEGLERRRGWWGDDEKSQILSAVAQRLASHQISLG